MAPSKTGTRPEGITSTELGGPSNQNDISQLKVEFKNMLSRLGKDRRFRVLVLGPRNAGKTTLLERLSDSPVGSAIVIRNGQRVMPQMLLLNRDLDVIFSFDFSDRRRTQGRI
jgi:septin family protein